MEFVAQQATVKTPADRLTGDVLFEGVWNRTEPAARDRGLVTVAALVAGGDTDRLRSRRAADVRGDERDEPTVHAAPGVTTSLATVRAALAPEVAAPTGTSRARGAVRS